MHHSVSYFNPYSNQIEHEPIYGERSLKFIYNNPLGKLTLHSLAKRSLFSKFYGWLMRQPSSKKKILPFIHKYHIDPSQFLKNPSEFSSFNDFFIRQLKPSARPIDPSPNSLSFPADARHLLLKNLSQDTYFSIKGASFNLLSFLQNPQLAKLYTHGSALISRLCPLDYHRFHFPTNGTPSSTTIIPGHLYSVNPLALKQNLSYLWLNLRHITTLQSPTFGLITLAEIGATCVGSILQSFSPNSPVLKGQEKGLFQFGGSCVITFLQPQPLSFNPQLSHYSSLRYEFYSHFGQPFASSP